MQLRTALPPLVAIFITGLVCSQPPHAATTDNRPNPENGAKLILKVGCGLCHRIPGIESAKGNVGPPLDGIGTRIFIAGKLNNTTDNMVRWLRFPQEVVPGNAMPDMGLNEEEARDIAAYLATIR
ncbi:MAG: c-type cytochrome [Hyphomicrobium sp.]|nr:c-type cytochrome [Hyphomicrobium sp.]